MSQAAAFTSSGAAANPDKMRQNARKRLWALRRRDGSKCAFCSEWLVIHYRDVPGRVLSIDHQEVTWRASDGTVVKSLIATIEHMIPVTRGGSNDLSNLRLSCFPCNARRAGHNPAEPRHHSECIHELEVGWHCHASCAVRRLQGNLL